MAPPPPLPPAEAPVSPAAAAGPRDSDAVSVCAAVVGADPQVDGSTGRLGPESNTPPARLVKPAGFMPFIAVVPGNPSGMTSAGRPNCPSRPEPVKPVSN